MLVTFTTDRYADIQMFGDVALAMLKMMGHSPTVPGAILAKDVPEALSQLTAAIKSGEIGSTSQGKEGEEFVSMAKRGKPLAELLESAVKSHADVMWK